VCGYVDADYAGDCDDRCSTSGYVFKVYGGAARWGSKKPFATVTSAVEAEFVAASLAVKEAAWLRGFLEEIDVPVQRVPLWSDNNKCIVNLRNPVNAKYTKRLAVPFHYARQAIALGQVDVSHIASVRNTADVKTKPLSPVLFNHHRAGLGVVAPAA
jgi:hypothetical protein